MQRVFYPPMIEPTSSIPDLLARLDVLAQLLGIREGFTLLDTLSKKVKAGSDISDRTLISLALCLVQWIDLGYANYPFLSRVIKRLPERNPEMPFLDVMRLNLIDSFIHLSREEPDRAITLLEQTCIAGSGLMPEYFIFLTHFWKGRAHRKRADYKHASWHNQEARASAERLQNPRLVAITSIHESWLLFQSGDVRRALQLLDEAEKELTPLGHALFIGNIESARGRFIRRSGRYEDALAHFERAIALYKNGFSHHPNLARSNVNAAYVRRLMALDLRSGANRGQARGPVHAKYLKLTHEALELLKQAADIYAHHHHHGGTGSVLVNAGFLHLESGDIEKASIDADRAFQLGEEKKDLILMARARNLQSAVNRARSEEQLDGDDDAYEYARLAIDLADEAIEIAKRTDHRRLLAEALIARGFAALDDQHRDVQGARLCASQAAALLGEGDRDHLFKDLGELKEKILRSVGVEDILRRWSEGQIGCKTFQQVQEEFAEIVIPRVWENLGRNVSRVSAQLSISPKKVRRLLQKANATTSMKISSSNKRTRPSST